jgi:hypothetical protein
VTLELHQDINTNGVVDAPDRLIRSFPLQDGVTNMLGSRVIPDDEDGATNGAIETRVSYFGEGGPVPLWHAVGNYLWRATTESSGEDVAVFTVTQPATTTWVTGEVLDFPSSNAVPGALVQLYAFSEHEGRLPTVYTDTNGLFSIYVPDGYPVANLSGVGAVAAGAMMAEDGPDGITSSGAPFMADLTAGENALTDPLLVVDGHGIGELDVYLHSGHVYDSATNPIAGAWVEAEVDEDDSDVWAIAVTDANGFFEVPLPAGDLSFSAITMVCNQRGVTPGWSELNVSGAVSDIELFCPAGEVLAKVEVRDGATSLPVPGAFVIFEGESSWNSDMTVEDGVCDIVLLEGTYEAFVEDDEILRLGYLPAWIDDVSVTLPSPCTNVNFELQSFVTFSGHVYDSQSNILAVAGGEVQAFLPQSWDWQGDADVNRQGYYEVAVATGSYRIVAHEFDGFLGQAYDGYYEWEWDNGPKGDPVVVGTGGVSGIDFYMEAGAAIRGVVMNEAGAPLNARVIVYEKQNGSDGPQWSHMFQTDTDGDDGTYELMVPAGTNYRVRAEGGGYLAQYYTGFYVYEVDVATPVNTSTGAPAENIDFALSDPQWIQGRIHSGDTDLQDVEVRVEWVWDEVDWWDSEFIGNAQSDSNGYYSIPCPPGANFAVRVSPNPSSFYVPMSWSNSFMGDDQTLVVVPSGSDVTDIDFDLSQGGRIEGSLFETNGVDPYYNGYVNARPINDSTWFGGNNNDGQYEISLPAGTYLVEFNDNGDSWPDQFYDGVFTSQRDSATVVTVAVGQVTGNIDFTMLVAPRIQGRITADGAPLDNIFVGADRVLDTNEWWRTDFAVGTETDGNGYYTLRVPPDATYVVSARPERGRLLGQYWSNTVSQEDATMLEITSMDVDGIDFNLTDGVLIEGRVTADGAPLDNIFVGADRVLDTNEWWITEFADGTDTDENGTYTLRVPLDATYVISARPESGHLIEQYWSNTVSREDATMLEITSMDVDDIDFALVEGIRIEGRVTYTNGAPVPDAWVRGNYQDTNGWGFSYGNGQTDYDGRYGIALPTGRTYAVSAGGNEGPWYPEQFYSNAVAFGNAMQLGGNAGETITNIDIELVPGFRVQGHIYQADGVTPVSDPSGEADSLTGERITGDANNDPTGIGWYEFLAPSGVPLLIEGHGDGVVNEYHDNAYTFSDATPVVGVPYTVTNIDFVLYRHDDDTDGDGLRDHQEDSRPDGVYVPGEDESSYTTNDTDGDLLDDWAEMGYGTSPTLADTDGDTHSDYEELRILYTDPTNRLSNLGCVGIGSDGAGGLRVIWSSVWGNGEYWIEACPDLSVPTPSWTEVGGPFLGSSSNTTSVVLSGLADSNAFYRITVKQADGPP